MGKILIEPIRNTINFLVTFNAFNIPIKTGTMIEVKAKQLRQKITGNDKKAIA